MNLFLDGTLSAFIAGLGVAIVVGLWVAARKILAGQRAAADRDAKVLAALVESDRAQCVRMDTQDEALTDIRHEVQLNNGSSVKDSVLRLEASHAQMLKAMRKLDRKLKQQRDTRLPVSP